MSVFSNDVTNYIIDTFALRSHKLEKLLVKQESGGGPMMNIAYDQAKLIQILLKSIKAKKVLEIGSYYGFSTICIAKALSEFKQAQLIAVEKSSKYCEIIKEHVKDFNVQSIVDIWQSNGLDAFGKLHQKSINFESFDAVFIDADKTNYPKYYHLAKPLIKSGGYLLVDNVLGMHSQEVVEIEHQEDKRVIAIRELNSLIAADKDFDSSIISVHGGMLIALKH